MAIKSNFNISFSLLVLLTLLLSSCKKEDPNYTRFTDEELKWVFWDTLNYSKIRKYSNAIYNQRYLVNGADTVLKEIMSQVLDVNSDRIEDSEIAYAKVEMWDDISIVLNKHNGFKVSYIMIEDYSDDIYLYIEQAKLESLIIAGQSYTDVYKWDIYPQGPYDLITLYYKPNYGFIKLVYNDGDIYELIR